MVSRARRTSLDTALYVPSARRTIPWLINQSIPRHGVSVASSQSYLRSRQLCADVPMHFSRAPWLIPEKTELRRSCLVLKTTSWLTALAPPLLQAWGSAPEERILEWCRHASPACASFWFSPTSLVAKSELFVARLRCFVLRVDSMLTATLRSWCDYCPLAHNETDSGEACAYGHPASAGEPGRTCRLSDPTPGPPPPGPAALPLNRSSEQRLLVVRPTPCHLGSSPPCNLTSLRVLPASPSSLWGWWS